MNLGTRLRNGWIFSSLVLVAPLLGAVDNTKPGSSVEAAVPPAQAEAPSGTPAPPLLDDFNRADGGLGGNWVNQNGYLVIAGQRAIGGIDDLSLVTFTGASGSAAADVDAGAIANLTYVALVLEYADLGNNLFLKVQNNGSLTGQFSHAACYYGNNGSGFGLGFFALSAPFTSARMTVWVEPNRDAVIDFSGIDGGAGTQSYTCPAAPVSGGTGVGMGAFYGASGTLDDFSAEGGAPSLLEIPALGRIGMLVLLAGLGLAAMVAIRRLRRA